jgi:hypothetical protein
MHRGGLSPPKRSGGLLRALLLLVTAAAILCVLALDGGYKGGAGPGHHASAPAQASGRQRSPLTLPPDPRLPSGVRALYPPLPPGAPDVFGPAVTRIIITFIGPHMNLFYTQCLRALVLQHCHAPSVRVLVWANELSADFLDSALGDVLRDGAGTPRLHLVRYNVSELAAGAPGAGETLEFLLHPPGEVQPSMEPQVRKAHVTDVVRMVVLWRFGGVYLDADILPLRPVHELGVAFSANLGNYECTRALNAGWPDNPPVAMPAALGGGTVSCMCICFLSFPQPGHPLIHAILAQGLPVFQSRSCVYGGLGAWLFMDALRAAVAAGESGAGPPLDARPISVSEALCWPQVLDAIPTQSEAAVEAIMRDCITVHMMGGAHANKFAQTRVDNSTLFGQVFNRIKLPAKCA